ncbi:unnamed protein product [Anisakis simplex]|uniref:AT-hook motif nuclear-localized protein n=1 Tax=Anisakis simplex TaxID=6269 RepID=A0A0M3KCG1_ANISI|nr:unnamed protein product [Anisakis simplex]
MSSPRVGTTRGRGRGRKRSRRYTPPIPSDNDHSQSRERDQTPDASLSPTMEFSKQGFQKLSKLIDSSSNSSIKTETLHVNQEDHQKNSTISGLTAILSGVPGIADESGASGLQDELEQIFSHANGASIPASNTDYSHPTSLLQQFGLCSPPKVTNGLNAAADGTTGNVFNTPTFYKRTRKEPSRTANSAPAEGNNDRKKPVARRGILLDYSGSDISPATIASSSQYARNRRYSSHNSTQGTQATDSPDYPSVYVVAFLPSSIHSLCFHFSDC